MTDKVKVYLDLEPINPKKQKRILETEDYADAYTIKITRGDGQKVTEDEAHTVISTFSMYQAFRRKRK